MVATLMSAACEPSSGDMYAGELPARVNFNFHVKPILSDRCFTCHGPDANARKAELRLDTEEGARSVIRAGSLRRSELFHRISSDDSTQIMPPRASGLTLSEYEKAVLARWIEQGAQYQPHWAFIPPELPEVPTLQDSAWARGPIDRFVQARLQRDGLEPSVEADPERLIRRLTYDLTGLPPTAEEIDRFQGDRTPEAYERVVDRLLASPAYGERMASDWLDVARYADSNGYQDDGIRYMSPWRDWVIESFNQNQPYDEFVTWQIAGDLLPNATREQILATGFNRNHPQNGEGGIVDEEYRIEYVADRTNTFSRAFMGISMECARCHDHKYDPITQKEYFRVFAFFNNNNEIGIAPIDGNGGPVLVLLDDSTEHRLGLVRQEMEEKEQALRSYVEQLRQDQQYLKRLPLPEPDLRRGLIAHFPLDAVAGEKTVNLADRSRPGSLNEGAEIVPGKLGGAVEFKESAVRADGEYPFERTDPFSLSAWVYPTEKLSHSPILTQEDGANRFTRGYSVSLDANNRVAAALTHSWPTNAIRVTSRDSVPLNGWTHVLVTYDGSSRARGLKIYLNGELDPAETIADSLDRTTVLNRLPFLIGGKSGSSDPSLFVGGRMDEVRIYDRMLTPPEVAQLAGRNSVEALRGRAPNEWTAQEMAGVLSYQLHTADRTYAERFAALRQTRAEENLLLSESRDVMVMQERPERRPTFILDRGVYDAPTEPVEPGTPESVLPFPEELPADRLGLAKWVFDPGNPLTARVAVNRYWQMLFGTGLVKSSDEFGNQGELPSHPELLDWLAVTYRDSGWDTKKLLKQMVMSSTYRQSSALTPELREKDPENRLLARGPSYRLPFEMIRDGALAASGLLVRKVGGPSVKPYQPDGLWEEKSAGRGALAKYVQDSGEDLYRRSLYTFWKLSSPPPAMMTFDAADRSVCTVRRARTNTPLQALGLLNDPQFVEAARVLAEHMIKEGGSEVDDRLRFGFRRVTSRIPSEVELQLLRSHYQKERAHFDGRQASALKLLQIGEWERDESLPPAEVAAYTVVANTLLNLDEFVTKR